jgi:hypothetical protein
MLSLLTRKRSFLLNDIVTLKHFWDNSPAGFGSGSQGGGFWKALPHFDHLVGHAVPCAKTLFEEKAKLTLTLAGKYWLYNRRQHNSEGQVNYKSPSLLEILPAFEDYCNLLEQL